jgi:potassium/chloride transporter 4/5/6
MLHDHQIKGFSKLVCTTNFNEGISCLTQTAGLGAFQPNCVLAAWPEGWRDQAQGQLIQARFIHTVQTAVELQKVMLVAKGGELLPNLQESLTGTIDIWWIVADGGILLLLPFLLKKHRVWHNCPMRLFAVARQEDDPERAKKELEGFVSDFRLNVEVHVKVIEDVILNAASFVTGAQTEPDESAKTPRQISSGILPIISRNHSGFPELPPGRSLASASARNQCDEIAPIAAASRQTIPGEHDIIEPATTTQGFVKSAEQQSSIEMDELELVKGLNQIIRPESSCAELVVTNLPDMLPGGSTPGYFALVEELTRGLQRCLLVRGTATEVITAFT